VRPLPKADLSRLRVAFERGLTTHFRETCQSIVDIGCGRCEECNLLLELFPGAGVTLIEIDETCAQELKRLGAKYPGRVVPVMGDALDPASMSAGPFQLAIIRHPDVQAAPAVWRQIVDTTINQIAVSGYLIVTTYTAAESEITRRFLQRKDCRDVAMKDMGCSPVALAGNDRYIMITEKI
jgi:hypothetical protein